MWLGHEKTDVNVQDGKQLQSPLKDIMKYNTSHFLDKLIEHEGLVLTVYKDSLGIDTIGIGRNLKDRGISKEELAYGYTEH